MYRDSQNTVTVPKTPIPTASKSNVAGFQTYEKAVMSTAFKDMTVNTPATIVANTFNTNNQQIAQQQSVRKPPSDTTHPFQKTYNSLVWS